MTQSSGENGTQQRLVAIRNNQLEGVDLFKDSKEVIILHRSEKYILRITGNGKLILTK